MPTHSCVRKLHGGPPRGAQGPRAAEGLPCTLRPPCTLASLQSTAGRRDPFQTGPGSPRPVLTRGSAGGCRREDATLGGLPFGGVWWSLPREDRSPPPVPGQLPVLVGVSLLPGCPADHRGSANHRTHPGLRAQSRLWTREGSPGSGPQPGQSGCPQHRARPHTGVAPHARERSRENSSCTALPRVWYRDVPMSRLAGPDRGHCWTPLPWALADVSPWTLLCWAWSLPPLSVERASRGRLHLARTLPPALGLPCRELGGSHRVQRLTHPDTDPVWNPREKPRGSE